MPLRDRLARAFGRNPGTDRVLAESASPGYGGRWFPDLISESGESAAGVHVGVDSAMRIAVAWRCVQVITGIVASLPVDLMRRVDERTRLPAAGHPFRGVLTVAPNRWQTPGEFKKMLQAHLLLRGRAFAYIRRVGRDVRELLPLDPTRMTVNQKDDLSLEYLYRTIKGGEARFAQGDILDLRGLSLDGVNTLSVIGYARNAMGLSIQVEKAGSRLFKHGTLAPIALEHPMKLGQEGLKNLRESIAESNAGAERAGAPLILEEGMKLSKVDFTADDVQFLATRQFQRADVGMFFGVPPHVYGDVEKSTSWGTGIEQQNIGFLTYTIQDWLRTWEEAFRRDCLAGESPDLYVLFDTKGFLRMDAATRREYFKAARGDGGGQAWMTANEIREKEDMEPRQEPWAEELPKGQSGAKEKKNESDKPPGNEDASNPGGN